MDQLPNLLLSGISTGSVYALVALGFNVIFKSTGAINFAQGEWVMMGGMVAAAAFAAQVPLGLAVLCAIAAVVVLALLSERFVVRRLPGQNALTVTLVMIAVAICFKSLVMLVLGKNPMSLPGFSGSTPIVFGSLRIHPQTLWIVLVCALVMVGAHWFFERTVLGRAMRAVAAQPEAAALCGIEPRMAMALSFGLAAAFGAIAGIVITPLTLTSFDHGTVLGFKGFSAAMLGGLGSLPGAILAGLLVGTVQSLMTAIWAPGADISVFALMTLGIIARPQGLLGKR